MVFVGDCNIFNSFLKLLTSSFIRIGFEMGGLLASDDNDIA